MDGMMEYGWIISNPSERWMWVRNDNNNHPLRSHENLKSKQKKQHTTTTTTTTHSSLPSPKGTQWDPPNQHHPTLRTRMTLSWWFGWPRIWSTSSKRPLMLHPTNKRGCTTRLRMRNKCMDCPTRRSGRCGNLSRVGRNKRESVCVCIFFAPSYFTHKHHSLLPELWFQTPLLDDNDDIMSGNSFSNTN